MKRTMKNPGPTPMQSELRFLKDPAKARILSGFFKTGPGEYGDGDHFLGIKAPDVRKIVKRHRQAPQQEILESLHSGYHEERLAALLILVDQYRRGDATRKNEIFNLYLGNTAYINSWDLVDLTAPQIVGDHLFRKSRSPLRKLARSDSLWERRIAILATFHCIRQGESRQTLEIAELLLNDSHDLIHKAVGWMLREVGKRCSIEEECAFLDRHAGTMPRTMLRYAVERFPEDLKAHYMKK
jgi:3-methyladenine DNA glycosylase AlkD